MPDYQLQIRQLITYPRCRIYREFLQTLIETRTSTPTDVPVFFVIQTCALLPASAQRTCGWRGLATPSAQEGASARLVAGLTRTLRLRSRCKTLELLQAMEDRGLLHYTLLGRGKLVRYKILDWQRCSCVRRRTAQTRIKAVPSSCPPP